MATSQLGLGEHRRFLPWQLLVKYLPKVSIREEGKQLWTLSSFFKKVSAKISHGKFKFVVEIPGLSKIAQLKLRSIY